MLVQLVLMRNRKRVWTAQLREKEATLGRAVGCTVRIPSAQVSRQHCRLFIKNGVVTVEDLESINGTFLNGKRINDREIVHPGDRLGVGPVTLVVEYELSTTTIEPLSSEEEQGICETRLDVEPVEEHGSQSDTEPPPLTAADIEVIEETPRPPKKKKKTTAKKPFKVEQETDIEAVPLAEEDELNLTDSGALRDFLIELDDTDSHPGE